MKRSLVVLFLWMVGSAFAGNRSAVKAEGNEYVVLASRSVEQDAAWKNVVETLCKRHAAEVLYYAERPAEALEALQRMRPRYVAVVEKPERITRDYIIAINTLSRQVTPSVYADFIWGIITGIDAGMAMKLADNAVEPLIVRNGLVAQQRPELTEADWQRFGYVRVGRSGLKTRREDTLAVEYWKPEKQFEVFCDFYKTVAPEFLLCESNVGNYHFSLPDNSSVHEDVYVENGDFRHMAWKVKVENNSIVHYDTVKNTPDWSGDRKVYIAAGSFGCDVDAPEKSCALAWMGAPNVTSMVGYPANRILLGQALWGGLKFWCATPGRYTMAESYFLSRQHLLHTLQEASPELLKTDYDYTRNASRNMSDVYREMQDIAGKQVAGDILGFWQERDLLAYFGDPKWDVRFPSQEDTYTLKTARKGKKYIITLTTNENFSPDAIEGTDIRMFDSGRDLGAPNTVGVIPFSVLFPDRLKNPRLASGQDWQVALSEDMMLVYEAWFEPGKTYEIVLLVD